MSDWEEEADNALLVEQDDDFDWEERDLSDEEEQENEKKRQEEEEKRKKAEEERQKKAAESALKNKKGPEKTSHASKKNSGMYKRYNETQAELDVAAEMFSGTEFEQLHIELLQPSSRKDYEDYGQMVGDMIAKNYSEGYDFQNCLKEIITRSTKKYGLKELQALQKHIEGLIVVKIHDKKENEQSKQKKAYAKVESKTEALKNEFLEGVEKPEENEIEEQGEDDFDSGDDFM